MADSKQRFVYRVEGFGNHVDFKMVEFLRELDAVLLCSWCGALKKTKPRLSSCGDVTCIDCATKAYNLEKCPVHGKQISSTVEIKWSKSAANERVRCVHAMRGCTSEPYFDELNGHLAHHCGFHIVACVRCGCAVPYKDMSTHYPTCKGAAEASKSSCAAFSLAEDLSNARKELEHALTLTNSDDHCELRKAVISASEMFARLEVQLAPVGSRLSDDSLEPQA